MKYIKEKAPSVKSKVKQINQKIGKLVSKKEDAINKAKEMADSEEPSGKMQASLAKIQLKQSESEAEKLMLQKQAEILKAKIDTAKKKEKTVADIEEMENRPITILEGVMSDIHQMINNHKNFDSFQKEFFKEYGHKKVMKKTPEFLEWLEALYNDSKFAVAEADAKPGPDPYMRGLDDDEEEKKEDKMKKQAEMDDDDPDAYKELPGDKEAKEKGEVKTSKHVKKYHELYGDKKDESMVSVIIEDFSQRKRNFTAELKGRMELAKNGETMKVGDLSWTKIKNNWKGGKYNRTEPHQLLVPFIADMLKKDIKSAATYNAEEVQDMVVFESTVNEEKAEGDRSKIADAKIETALKTKAEETGVPIGLIRIVMRRGMAAWKTGHRPGATEQQWGYARVNAFLTKGEGTWGGADKDVAKEVRDGGHDKGLKERIESDIRLSDKVVAFKTDDSSFNGQSPNTITCNNCTWTWMKQDGGDDMYVCHKCGTNNAPLLGESTLNEEDTYNDYPAAAKKNAKKALDWRDEHGRDEVDAGTAVGWTRANQLAKGEKISADTVKRMASFNRHRKNSSIKAELKATPWKDKGYVSWLIWGGDEGVDWAMKKSKEIDNMKNESKQMKYIKPLNEVVTEGIHAKQSIIQPGEYIKTQYGHIYKRVEGKVGGQDAYIEVKKGKEGKRKTSIHDTVDFDIVDKDTAFESVVNEARIKVTKDEWPYLEFKVGSKLHKVDFDYEDIIDDHGNEGQDQYWVGKDEKGQDWMIDVYANYMGDVEEVHYDTIVKESVSSEFSPMGYAKRVVSGAIKIKDAMKEAGISLANMAKLIKRIDKSFDVDAAFLEKNVMQDDPEKFNESKSMKYIKPLTEGLSKSAIKKAIKVIDQQIEDEEGGDGEPLDNETLQALEQERERLLGMMNERKHIKSINEGYWSSYEYDKWTKENGKPKYPKWVKTTLKEIVKGGFMEPVYDAEHNYMVLWLASLENKNRAELYAYDKKGEKVLGKVGYAMYQRFYNDLTGYNMFFMQGAMYALEVSKNIKDRVDNGEPVEPAYYMMKEYFNNFGMDTKRSRVFNAAYEKLEKWMKENSIPTL